MTREEFFKALRTNGADDELIAAVAEKLKQFGMDRDDWYAKVDADKLSKGMLLADMLNRGGDVKLGEIESTVHPDEVITFMKNMATQAALSFPEAANLVNENKLVDKIQDLISANCGDLPQPVFLLLALPMAAAAIQTSVMDIDDLRVKGHDKEKEQTAAKLTEETFKERLRMDGIKEAVIDVVWKTRPKNWEESIPNDITKWIDGVEAAIRQLYPDFKARFDIDGFTK